jgi:outer membrane protein assembly factor BamB
MKVAPDGGVLCVGFNHDGVVSKYSSDGTIAWTQTYSSAAGGESGATCVDVAQNGEIFVAGYTAFQNNDIFVLRLGPDGSKRFSVTYDSPQSGSDIANAIIVDKSGNVYVTGYSTTPEGGSEFVTIKYAPGATIQANPDGTMHVEFRSTPGHPYSIEATTNFFNWQSLITNTVDVNGRLQFDDTNAPSIPYRFYRGNFAP